MSFRANFRNGEIERERALEEFEDLDVLDSLSGVPRVFFNDMVLEPASL